MYTVEADWLIAADGARSPIRRMLGLEVEGKIFMDRFLIADVVMKADFPAERWFWFDPPFHPNQSVLLHKQTDSVFRIDFQLGWDADPEEEKKPENVIPRIKAMLGTSANSSWNGSASIPSSAGAWPNSIMAACSSSAMRRTRFRPSARAGPIPACRTPTTWAGSSSWCSRARRRPALLDSYSEERVYAADENLMNSTRSTDFITPKSRASRTFRNAILSLAKDHAFGRSLVNSGRLSVPSFLVDSSLNTATIPTASPAACCRARRWTMRRSRKTAPRAGCCKVPATASS
jgi:3-(3-hydroxy-phenyl)propionate hydroxylase